MFIKTFDDPLVAICNSCANLFLKKKIIQLLSMLAIQDISIFDDTDSERRVMLCYIIKPILLFFFRTSTTFSEGISILEKALCCGCPAINLTFSTVSNKSFKCSGNSRFSGQVRQFSALISYILEGAASVNSESSHMGLRFLTSISLVPLNLHDGSNLVYSV